MILSSDFIWFCKWVAQQFADLNYSNECFLVQEVIFNQYLISPYVLNPVLRS